MLISNMKTYGNIKHTGKGKYIIKFRVLDNMRVLRVTWWLS